MIWIADRNCGYIVGTGPQNKNFVRKKGSPHLCAAAVTASETVKGKKKIVEKSSPSKYSK